MECRQEFEAWVTRPPMQRSVRKYPSDTKTFTLGDYKDHGTQLAWKAWKAAWEYHSKELEDVFTLKTPRKFSCCNCTFECPEGQKVILRRRDNVNKRVLLDFGGGLQDWFPRDVLLDFVMDG